MKLNLEFYKEHEETLSDDENKVLEYAGKNNSFEEVFEKSPTVNTYIHLSNVKENLLNWYEFKDNSSILEIGAGFGELTNLLVRKSNYVVAIELSLKKAKFLEEKFKENSDNLELIVGNLKDIILDKKFDYIVITDYLEKNDFCETLEYIEKYLKEDGTILIALDNKYGIKNWKGKDNYKSLLDNKSKSTKKCIENKLNKLGFCNYKFYYIYPEYKAPNLIYTDMHEITIEDISRNFELNEISEETGFRENELLENLIKDEKEKMNFFANSFLIEISNSILTDVKYVTFSNYRKNNKQIQTIITSEKVIKKPVTKDAENHIKEMINNMQYFPKENCILLDKKRDEVSVESDFINGKKLDEIIESSLNVKEEFDKYKDFLFKSNKIIKYEEIDKEDLLEPLKELDEDVLKNLTFTEYGFVDMIPKNCFVIGGMNFFFDQEWMLKNIPLEFILYRAIKNIYLVNRDELYRQYSLDKNQGLFEKIEEIFSSSIIHKDIINNILMKPATSIKQKINSLEVNIGDLQSKIEEKDNKIINLENKNQNLVLAVKERDTRLTIIANSVSWKITKPIRWISEKVRKILNSFKKGEN